MPGEYQHWTRHSMLTIKSESKASTSKLPALHNSLVDRIANYCVRTRVQEMKHVMWIPALTKQIPIQVSAPTTQFKESCASNLRQNRTRKQFHEGILLCDLVADCPALSLLSDQPGRLRNHFRECAVDFHVVLLPRNETAQKYATNT